MVACESIAVRGGCGSGDVLDTRFAFYRRILETGNGRSGDLFSSFSSKQKGGYRGLRDYKIREYRDSILEPARTYDPMICLRLVKMALPKLRHFARIDYFFRFEKF